MNFNDNLKTFYSHFNLCESNLYILSKFYVDKGHYNFNNLRRFVNTIPIGFNGGAQSIIHYRGHH
jgi:hypothetical protein